MHRLLFLLVLAAVPDVANAGLSYICQDRQILAYTGIVDDAPKVAGDFGPFSAKSLSEYSTNTGDHVGASASMTSTLGADAIHASGSVAADSGGGYESTYRALHRATFDVAEPTRFTLTAGLTNWDVNVFGFDLPGPLLSVRLVPVGPNTGAALVDEKWTDQDVQFGTHGTPRVDDRTGTLQPGRYLLAVDVQTTMYEGGESADYVLDFTTRAAGGPPSAVPLPPAGSAGLLALAGLAGRQWAVARRRRLLAR